MVTTASFDQQLTRFVMSTNWMVRALHAAREVDPPDWLIGAGAIRGLVWDRLHGADAADLPNDIDLIFFDGESLDEQRETEVADRLRKQAPDLPWDVKNQAAVHLWYPRVFGVKVRPLISSADAVTTWPETATSVAIRLLANGRLTIVAPFGLEDLFELICRRNPNRVTVEEYRRRVQQKQIGLRWPMVTVL